MIEVTEHIRDVLLEVAKNKKIYVEGNFLKILKSAPGDKEFEEYLKLCQEKDKTTRKKRLQVTKQVQTQNKQLVTQQKEKDSLMEELQIALDEARDAEWEAQKLREEAEKSKDKALEDLELMQKKTQFELIGRIVRVALWVILGVGLITTLLFAYTLVSGEENPILESTWSNLFGILLTNSFSIIGTIMGVKYASKNEN